MAGRFYLVQPNSEYEEVRTEGLRFSQIAALAKSVPKLLEFGKKIYDIQKLDSCAYAKRFLISEDTHKQLSATFEEFQFEQEMASAQTKLTQGLAGQMRLLKDYAKVATNRNEALWYGFKMTYYATNRLTKLHDQFRTIGVKILLSSGISAQEANQKWDAGECHANTEFANAIKARFVYMIRHLVTDR